jgi:hypothetical protein
MDQQQKKKKKKKKKRRRRRRSWSVLEISVALPLASLLQLLRPVDRSHLYGP